MTRQDLVLAGAGLANGLIAYRLATKRPDLRVTLVETAPEPGGNHTWSFHEADLTDAQAAWLDPFVVHRWPAYDVRFPGRNRRVRLGYRSVTSERFAAVLRAKLGPSLRCGEAVERVEPERVVLASGETIAAAAVIDGRGFRPGPNLDLAYQLFLGRELQLDAPHGIDVPVLMDATVAQHGGYRFVYVLPLSPDRLLVEDTYYADEPTLDVETLRGRIDAYAAVMGWQVRAVLREEQGVLPITLDGRIEAFWREAGRDVAVSGLRAGLFHPTTGYSLPDAVRLADHLAGLPDLSGPAIAQAIQSRAVDLWRAQGFYRLLNRLLFHAGPSAERFRMLGRFYGMRDPLIARFYAGRLRISDKARILSGWPPVPLLGAVRVLLSRPSIASRLMRTATVIGAGFGGLALAIRLQSAGIRTTLIEKRDKPGGRAYVYEDQGFTFDAGPTVITDPSAIEELFTGAGRRLEDYVELLPVSPFYRLSWESGYSFDYVNDQAALDRQIAAKSPADVAGYARFLDYSKAVFEEGYVKLGAVPFLQFRDMVRAGPALARLQAWRSVYGIVSRFIADEELRQAFSFHSLLVGGNPFATSSIYALIHALERRWGVWFPRGGTGALVDGMIRLFRDIGGEVRLASPVEEITVEEGRATSVRLAGGERIEADAVASNADVVHTYGRLLGRTDRGRREAKRLTGKRHSMSLFVIYFGLRRHRPELPHHNVLFGPRYRDLIDEIFRRETLADDFSLYLHAPCATDPSLAPPGAGSFYVLAPVPHLGTAAIDWDKEAPRYRDRILAYLEARCLPGLRDDLVTMRCFTPVDFRDELNAHNGSAFSLEPILTQSAWFRPHNRDDVIPNLYIVGAGTHPGAGVPGVIGSAKATAGLMIDDLRLSERPLRAGA